MPTNACFNSLTSVGVPRLRRVLRSLAWLYPDIGYCQGTGMVRTHTESLSDQLHYSEQLIQHRRYSPLYALIVSHICLIHPGCFLPVALSRGGGCTMDDVRPDRRSSSSILLFLHSAGRSNGSESSPPTYCSVPAGP